MEKLSKTILIFLFILAVSFFGRKEVNKSYAQSYSSPYGGAFVDFFNDGIIGDQYETHATGDSSIYETGGVLYMETAQGPRPDTGTGQVVSATTKEDFLNGDFDVKVDFELNPTFYSDPEGVIVSLDVGTDVIEGVRKYYRVAIHHGGYNSTEGFVAEIGGGEDVYNWTPANDIEGKLRIKREGNHITTYYWNHGWVEQSDWEGKIVTSSDNLKITLFAYNSQPDYPSFWVKWDNLIAHYHIVP